MKKFYFSLIIAAMAAVSMNAEPVQQDIPLTIENWGWGYNCTVTTVEGGLQTQLTGDWGALSTGWDPVIDLTEWDKIIFLVKSMEGCTITMPMVANSNISLLTSNRRKKVSISPKHASWLFSAKRMVLSS